MKYQGHSECVEPKCSFSTSMLWATAVQVGDVVVMFGSSAILPCHISTNDHLSQITWQRTIKGKAPDDVFLIIQPKIGLKYRNKKDFRFEFIGNFNDKNGTLKFSNVTLKDEGSYSCIFSLFPGGTPSRNSQLVILEGNEEVPLATCTAAASKPKAEVRWIKGSLEGKVREELKETQHANGTTTTWSTLLGKPGREMNGQLVQCVISSEATNEEILETNIQVHCKYLQTSSKAYYSVKVRNAERITNAGLEGKTGHRWKDCWTTCPPFIPMDPSRISVVRRPEGDL
uniref:Ig-like domain-containing protein n=1 Tax=Oryzias latipes TaxID=8090 RepID=A0A3P9J7B5_ORYLA